MTRYYHHSNHPFAPGDIVEPASATGRSNGWEHVPGYSSKHVYMSHEDADPLSYEQHGKHRYEVEPLGPVHRDPEFAHNLKDYGPEDADEPEEWDESDVPGYHSYVAPRARVVRTAAKNSDSNWRPGIPSPDLNNPEHGRMLQEENKGVDREDLATSPTITRGMTIGGHFHPDAVKRLADGTAHLHDVMHHVDTQNVGDYWHGHHHSLEDAKIYAEGEHEHHPVHELGEEQYEDRHNPGNFGHPGQINVVLEAHRPKGWDPNKNPDSGVMGNSYLAHPTTLKLHKVHFQSPDGNWHGIDATGHTVHATGEAQGETHAYGDPYPDYEGADHHQHKQGAKKYPPRRYEHSGVPFKRIFGPTDGLDVRLFDDHHLKPAIRADLMRKWHEFCEAFGLYDPDDWSIVYFAGSEASEWTSKERKGNNDFDVLVGVSTSLFCTGPYAEHRQARARHLGWPITPEGLAAGITESMRSTPGMVKTDYRLPGELDDGSDFDQTWYVNPSSYHIADIKPYAAYDVTHDRWAVKPPHLPGWSISDFPEGPALEDYCWGMEDMVRSTLDMPEPYRHQEGFALWHFVHDTRSGAFGPQGEGWYDPRNVLEKWLDQKGLMAHLWTLMHEAVDDPHLLDSPVDWNNTPVMAMLVHSALLGSCAPDDPQVLLATASPTTPEVR